MTESNSARQALVGAALQRWRSRLSVTDARSPLRNYRDLRVSTLDLMPGGSAGLDRAALDRLLSGRRVNLSALFSGDKGDAGAFGDARRRMANIRKKALSNLEEKGISTLFLGVGLASWDESVRVGRTNAPVALTPLTAEAVGAGAADFGIEVSGEPRLNPVLAHILESEWAVDPDDVETLLEQSNLRSIEGYRTILDRCRQLWARLPGLGIERRVILANFAYRSMPMVEDLGNADAYVDNDLVAAIAGDVGARVALQRGIVEADPSIPDYASPATEFIVLDADSSQHAAINRVRGGASLVVQGPPGTGKSQTIANLIATLVADGKRVLFVAEKRAAIEAVTKRLNHVGLGALVMDMHGGVNSRREFAQSLKESLDRVPSIPARDDTELHERLEQRRQRLRNNDLALHDVREPWGLSVHQMRTQLLEAKRRLPQHALSSLHISLSAVQKLNREAINRAASEAEEWVDLGGPTFDVDHPEWARSVLATPEDARRALDLVHDLNRLLADARRSVGRATAGLRIPVRDSVAEWEDAMDELESVADILRRYGNDALDLDADALIPALLSGQGSAPRHFWAQLTSGGYRSARRQVAAAVAAGASATLLTDEMVELLKVVRRAREIGATPRTMPRNLVELRDEIGVVAGELRELSEAAGVEELLDMPVDGLAGALQRMSSDPVAVSRMPRIRELQERFRKEGLTPVLARVGEDVPPESAGAAVAYACLQSILENIAIEDQRLGAFDGRAQSRYRSEFAEADRQHIQLTPRRLERMVAESVVRTMDKHPEETALIKHEAAKRARHLPLNRLFREAPNVLTAVRPCWTMSPILVSEVLPARSDLFDVVVFDEASQIPPAEAIGSLARAPQAVIAGDSRQLPPTDFFSANAEGSDNGNDSDEPEDYVQDIESLLDAAAPLLQSEMLRWHYRSRDERLIAFSNRHIYGGGLTAFPGAAVEVPISHEQVPFRSIVTGGGTASNPDEVERVVELVLNHARHRGEESLGVIAFGQAHADNIENQLLNRLRAESTPDLDGFFSETREERFFVKNIERVQGDERDAIILSVGYHKDAGGRLPYRFGPLLREGGERRLNVAVTRARNRLTLVSSFNHHDMAPGRSNAKGVEQLRMYLEFAASGGANLGVDALDTPLNALELDIRDGLERRGIPVFPQYGVGTYRIDFACAHPDRPGQMVLAIEADGAQYHSSPTARDRDRLRQQVLEDKGWRFHRIWSTSWFMDREGELDRAEEAWRRAVREVSEPKASPRKPPPEAPSEPPPPPPGARAARTGERPNVPVRGSRYGFDSISDYSDRQLVLLARWIESDSLLRTEEQLLRELMAELGFTRKGAIIEERLKKAIALARRSP